MSETTHTYINKRVKNPKPFFNIYFFTFYIYFFQVEKCPNILQLNIKKRKASKKGCERYQDLSDEEKNKSNNMAVNNIKISQMTKKQWLVGYRKKYKIWKNKTTSEIKTDLCFLR